ncbi:MAG: hypothetical protein M3011_11090 [Actinomycetota bacterium]|nr:hypothetical protein [Actinomycetota bacterium]
MTLFTRFLGLALLATLVLCVVVVLTAGHPQTALNDIGDMYHCVAH